MARALERCMGEHQHWPAPGAVGTLAVPRLERHESTGQALDPLTR
jgi:hypothetical protein